MFFSHLNYVCFIDFCNITNNFILLIGLISRWYTVSLKWLKNTRNWHRCTWYDIEMVMGPFTLISMNIDEIWWIFSIEEIDYTVYFLQIAYKDMTFFLSLILWYFSYQNSRFTGRQPLAKGQQWSKSDTNRNH